MDTRIGELIKQIRKNNKITLEDLAGSTGLSVSYLSTIERGITSPTIINLQKICQELGVTLSDLISTVDDDKIHIKKDQRRIIFDDRDNVVYEAITEGNRRIKSICMTVYDNREHPSAKHISDEFGYIVSGSLIMTVDGIAYDLQSGDSLYISANTTHTFRKTSDEPCISIWSYHNLSSEEVVNYPSIPKI